MQKQITMPQLRDEMKSGVFCAWLKEEGQPYKKGEPIFEIETDKVVNQITASEDGVLLRKLVEVPQYREKFLTRYAELFNTVLTTENMVSLFNEMILEIKPEMQMHNQRWAAEMPTQVSFDQPKNAEGGYNYWVTRCERAIRVMNRRPHFIWLDIQSYFGLSDAEMTERFGPCPVIPDEYK